MALHDWILDSGQVATLTVATTATPDKGKARTVATVATVAVARGEKREIKKEEVPVLAEVMDWLRPCPICTGLLFHECVRGGYFCPDCQPLPPGDIKRIVRAGLLKIEESTKSCKPQGFSKGCGQSEAGFSPGLAWCQDHLDDLLAAGWTKGELFKETWPIGLAWMQAWSRPGVAVIVDDRGGVVFDIARHDGSTVKQIARPNGGITHG